MSVHDRGEMGNGEGQTEYNNIRNRQTEYNNIRNRVMRHIPPTRPPDASHDPLTMKTKHFAEPDKLNLAKGLREYVCRV